MKDGHTKRHDRLRRLGEKHEDSDMRKAYVRWLKTFPKGYQGSVWECWLSGYLQGEKDAPYGR